MSEQRKCKTCGKMTEKTDHQCVSEEQSYVCEFCGGTAGEGRHLCKPMFVKVNYFCDFCGRISPEKDTLCQPKPLGEKK